MASCHTGIDQLDIKRHGLWKSDAFWQNITTLCVAWSSVMVALASAITASV